MLTFPLRTFKVMNNFIFRQDPGTVTRMQHGIPLKYPIYQLIKNLIYCNALESFEYCSDTKKTSYSYLCTSVVGLSLQQVIVESLKPVNYDKN